VRALSQRTVASGSAAWHYTSGQCATQILKSGLILPADGYVPRGEKAAVWFSLDQFWERTASKGILDPSTRVRRFATMNEMEQFAGGCYRFGIQNTRLLCWSALKVKTRMRPKTVRALERVAYEVGSNPNNWLGTLEPIPVSEVIALQRLVGGAWNVVPELLPTANRPVERVSERDFEEPQHLPQFSCGVAL
jgi:hypothetical protein